MAYTAAWGAACFPLGRLLKRLPLNWERPPFAGMAWERGGAVYEGLGIRCWKDIAPDVSRWFPGIVPRKAFSGMVTAQKARDMLAETCVAELTHLILCLTGLVMLPLWPGAGGLVYYGIYALLGNLPFIAIQRYNRPRYRQLLEKAERRERRLGDARTDTVEQ